MMLSVSLSSVHVVSTSLFEIFFSHRTKTAQYDHPVRHLLVEDNLPYPSKNSLVPANPYMYAGKYDS